MAANKKYFPNRWKAYKDAPDEMFMQHSYLEIMQYKIGGWELPSNVCCIIRSRNKDTLKVKEYVYQYPKVADKKIDQLIDCHELELTICTPDSIHFVSTDTDHEQQIF